jgi:hypothetical protein
MGCLDMVVYTLARGGPCAMPFKNDESVCAGAKNETIWRRTFCFRVHHKVSSEDQAGRSTNWMAAMDDPSVDKRQTHWDIAVMSK